MSSATWRRVTVLLALALSAFTFNTTENLPIGLLPLISEDLDVTFSSVGYLVTGYGLTVAVVSLPLAQVTRDLPRRWVLTGVLAVLVMSTLVSIVAASYWVLLTARIATAVAQALFWAVMAPVAVGLFAPEVRGRVIAVMSVGGSLATVLGVPAGTWLGQQGGWRAPFLVLTALSLAALVLIAALLPTSRPQDSHGAYGSAPHTGRFVVTLLATAVSVTGMFAGFTYVVQLLTDVTGFTDETVSALLFVFGLAGIAGVSGVGQILDRFPNGSLVLTIGLQAVALLGLWLFATEKVAVIAMLALLGASAAPVFMATQARILVVAPGRTEIGFAANSAAFNVGIAVGAAVGGLVLAPLGARGVFGIGALVTFAALAVVAGESLLADRPGGGPRPDGQPSSPAGRKVAT
ncbi:MFS transporter [Micromonospora sagamiensis]|uniref:DHA1 family inner membrane transport protein n=1 Tax=Micromonospora sagamiensis TaxID=47875 RepID=A0A562WJC1_9ACTN|nr:MFS transporter [Micromonospora sagamiensis]TWJ30399.1 DHA1 family inner membrane transport protein [Micromonospora sagamiensis]BCL16571.1 putative sugar efflux transporter [Micromonospora sagamiensis]